MKKAMLLSMLLLFFYVKAYCGTLTNNQDPFSGFTEVNQQNPYYNIFNQVGKQYNINPLLLYSIAYNESSLNPNAINHNTNGSYDYGLMQVNSSNLSSLGLNTSNVFDPQANVNAGAKVLSACIQTFGASWLAVDCYNKGYNKNVLNIDNAYPQRVKVIYQMASSSGGIFSKIAGKISKAVSDIKNGVGEVVSNLPKITIIITLLAVVIYLGYLIFGVLGIISTIVSMLLGTFTGMMGAFHTSHKKSPDSKNSN